MLPRFTSSQLLTKHWCRTNHWDFQSWNSDTIQERKVWRERGNTQSTCSRKRKLCQTYNVLFQNNSAVCSMCHQSDNLQLDPHITANRVYWVRAGVSLLLTHKSLFPPFITFETMSQLSPCARIHPGSQITAQIEPQAIGHSNSSKTPNGGSADTRHHVQSLPIRTPSQLAKGLNCNWF